MVWGNGTSGQLGLGDLRNVEKPQLLEFFRDIDVESVQCDAAQSAVITKTGKLYVWGWRGNMEPITSPQLVTHLESHRVSKVCLGAYHIIAIVEKPGFESLVYTWGNNDKGQLGNGSTIPLKYPLRVESLKGINAVDISASEASSAVLTGNWISIGMCEWCLI